MLAYCGAALRTRGQQKGGSASNGQWCYSYPSICASAGLCVWTVLGAAAAAHPHLCLAASVVVAVVVGCSCSCSCSGYGCGCGCGSGVGSGTIISRA